MKPELIAVENMPLALQAVGQKLVDAIVGIPHMEYAAQHMIELLCDGRAQLWVSPDGEVLIVTRILNYPSVKRLIIDLVVGKDHMRYVSLMEHIESWAVSLGATEAEAEIRPGLWKAARQEGWTKQRVKVFKNLRHEIH